MAQGQSPRGLDGKTVLVTGGAGFIGSNVALHLQRHHPGCRVVVVDCFGAAADAPGPRAFGHYLNLIDFAGELICGDLTEPRDLARLQRLRYDLILHFAAVSDTRVYDQAAILRANVNVFADLLRLAARRGADLVYASSAATYGAAPAPQRIGHEAPDTPYGFSKLKMDQMAARFRQEHPGLAVAGLRFFNVYGPREYFKGTTASMVLQLGHQLLAGRAPRLFHGSEHILRDFVHVEDVVRAVLAAAAGRVSGVFNVGSGRAESFARVLELLQQGLGTALPIDYIDNPHHAYQTHTRAELETTRAALGYAPEYDLARGVAAYLPEIRRSYREWGAGVSGC
ncbi:ADP-glyceromanno-heptose 6-epimerase [Marichromatium gracile]|uniref:ADP-glyceromanno-heptose 6-epimerase n=1 Tax=Marichromatium gracile TaxID=1048 RepID=UPI001F16214F|nr:ADP-glyceromanno-heptose 6-epimerase [Marichromatium gracile]MCF1182788.1 ADP-glyceromanno-heptose 6-epimerase [Marichromatium gracile]